MPMTQAFALVELALTPLDWARREAFRRAARVRWIRQIWRRKDTRIPLLACASVIVSFAFTLTLPDLLLVAGPILLGVPHLASDFRYLVLRRRLPKAWLALISLGSALLFIWRILEIEWARALRYAELEAVFGFSWALVGLWLGAVPSRRWWRAALATLPLAAAACVAVRYATSARLVLAYGHNVMALIIWFFLFRGNQARAALPLALVAAGAFGVARQGVPGHVQLFLQAVHYSVWLAWIPQEELGGNATLTFGMSARAARRDFGAIGMALIAVATLAMIAASTLGAHRAREAYLFLAGFHAYLEIACLAFFFGRAELSARDAPPQELSR